MLRPTNSAACSVTPPACSSTATAKSSSASPASSMKTKSPNGSSPSSDTLKPEAMDEKDFQRKADAAFDDLKRRLLTLGDQHDFDVEGQSGKLEVIFEEPEEAKFVISP